VPTPPGLSAIATSWLTNAALSGARLYWESWGKLGYFNAKDVSIPVAVSVSPDELYPAPRSWAERAYPKLIYYNKLDKGGHFTAWEQRNFFRKSFARASDHGVNSEAEDVLRSSTSLPSIRRAKAPCLGPAA
jgi:hypothetical protein